MEETGKRRFGWIKFRGRELSDGYISQTPKLQFILVSLLFPMWGAAASLNDILITQFKTIFNLSNFASAYVQSAFFLGYFVMAIPASYLIKRTSYRFTIVVGLALYLVGSALFFPASAAATYGFFLLALFVLATGLSLIETSADTYSALLGPERGRTLRLNISQTFLPVGSIVGILLGKYLIFTDGDNLKTQLAGLNASERIHFGEQALQQTLLPYRYMIMALVVMMIIFLVVQFPKCKPVIAASTHKDSLWQTIQDLLKNKNYRYGLFTQFMYVGLQVSVWSFTIQLALSLNPALNERSASNFVIYSYIAFFLGRVLADYLMRTIPHLKVLLAYASLEFLAIVYMLIDHSFNGVYVAILVSGLMGPGFATIYTETLSFVKNPQHTETAGAMLVMMVSGGAFWPLVQGWLADVTGSMSLSFAVHLLTFGAIAAFAYRYLRFPVKD